MGRTYSTHCTSFGVYVTRILYIVFGILFRMHWGKGPSQRSFTSLMKPDTNKYMSKDILLGNLWDIGWTSLNTSRQVCVCAHNTECSDVVGVSASSLEDGLNLLLWIRYFIDFLSHTSINSNSTRIPFPSPVPYLSETASLFVNLAIMQKS